jgi:hypothetical protein
LKLPPNATTARQVKTPYWIQELAKASQSAMEACSKGSLDQYELPSLAAR